MGTATIEAIRNAIATLLVAGVLGLSSWAFRANDLLTQHETVMKVLVSPAGGVNPSVDALLTKDRLAAHLKRHETRRCLYAIDELSTDKTQQ